MSIELTSRMRAALDCLRYECEYEDQHNNNSDNFILRSKLPANVGDKTIADLLSLGLIETGTNRWFDETGYRITDLGLQALAEEPQPKVRTPRPKLKPLPSRIGKAKGPLDR